MNQKILIATLITLGTTLCNVAGAAPLTDYSAGKTALDVTGRRSGASMDFSLNKFSYDEKGNADWGATVGLGNKFALQVNDFHSKSKVTAIAYGNDSYTIKTREINLLYQLDKNVSAFVGSVENKGITYRPAMNMSWETETKNQAQFGIIAHKKIADKTTAYAQAGFAANFADWRIGLSRELSPNVDLNFDYRRVNIDEIYFSGTSSDVNLTAQGWGVGLTYKF